MQTKRPAAGGQVERVVRPVAEVKSARLRWHLATPDADPVAKFLDNQTHPLYDQDALDAAVAAEHELAVRVLADVLQTSGAHKLHATREEDARVLLRLARERA